MKKIIAIISLMCFFFCGKSQDTVCTSEHFDHDTLQSVHIDERIVYTGDSVITISDTSYTKLLYYTNKTYDSAYVTADYTYTIQLFDTIPAWDSVFICHCASHDSTICVVYADTTNHTEYGTFMINQPPPSVSIATRINIMKTKHMGKWWRSSYDRGKGASAWDVKQVHDSALLSIMSINNTHPGDHIDHPTGLSLDTFMNDFSARVRQQKPDIISPQNEPANKNYWNTANVYDYITLFSRCVDTAHKYGVPITDGGMIHVYWYVQDWFEKHGKHDSAVWVKKKVNVAPNFIPLWGQAFVDWYNVFIPWLTASNVDYANIHWYRPIIQTVPDINADDTLFYVCAKKIAEVTGKTVISNEIGTRAGDQTYFNKCMDEFEKALRIMIYFNGSGAGAVKEEDWWAAWLNQ